MPIRFLRQPDRWVQAKPWQAERINPFPTGVRRKIQHCTAVARGTHGFHHLRVHRKTQRRTCVTRNAMVSTIVPNRDTRDNRIRRCVNALLKFRFDVADAVKLAVLIPEKIELKLLALLDA